MNITKILLSVMAGVIITTPTFAANTMCVTSDNNSIVLNPSTDGTEHTGEEEMKTWTTIFPYGTVRGIATCNSTEGTFAHAYPEYDFGDDYASSEGVYCWCRMTYPVRSAWVINYERDSADICASHCASRCGNILKTNLSFRVSMYGSAGM